MVMRLLRSLSATGLLLAMLAAAASLTPSLMPRTYLIQGGLSGICAGTGYLVGVIIEWLLRYMEVPQPFARSPRVRAATLAVAATVALTALWHAVGWQNSIRKLWNLAPVDSADPVLLVLVALGTFVVLLILGRCFRLLAGRFSDWLDRLVPRRVSNVLGVILAATIFWFVGQGLVLRWAVDAADASFRQVDAMLDDGVAPPSDPGMTGSVASQIAWDGLGRQGRHFISSGPRGPAIADFWKEPAKDPVRVYVGLNNAETPADRAALALKELQRQKAFDRSILVIVAPTGTGWVDPAAMDPLEYLHKGDVASVALQYSYLASWLSLMVEPENGQEAAAALFNEVYHYWKTLPKDHRPRLYLHGLSLGALNSQLSTDIYDVVADPFQGALWSGPPFRSAMWRSLTAQREKGSPAWLPTFRDGSIVRFANQATPPAQDNWGPIRMVYLQYASDPIVFFEASSWYREPDWLRHPRGPDVSPDLRWFPVVTMLQLAFDMAIGTSSPIGHGHVYAPSDYIDAWVSLTDPVGLTRVDVERLKAFESKQMW